MGRRMHPIVATTSSRRTSPAWSSRRRGSPQIRQPGQFVIVRRGRGRRADPADDRRRGRRGGHDHAHHPGHRQEHDGPRRARGRATPSATSPARWAGRPSCSSGHAVCVGGGVGTAVVLPDRPGARIAAASRSRASSAAARASGSSSRTSCAGYGEVVVCTDDGSYGRHGFVTQALADVLDAGGDRRGLRRRPGADDARRGRADPPVRGPDHRLAQPDHGRRHRHVRRLPGRASAARRCTPASTGPSSTATQVDFALLADRLTHVPRRSSRQRWRRARGLPTSRGTRHDATPRDATARCRPMTEQRPPLTPKERMTIERRRDARAGRRPSARATSARSTSGSPSSWRCSRPSAACSARTRSASTAARSASTSRASSTCCARATCAAPPIRCSTTTPCRASPAGSARRRPSARASACAARRATPVAIGYLERFVADWARPHRDELHHATPPPSGTTRRDRRLRPGRPDRRRRARQARPRGHRLRGLPRRRRRAHLRHPRVPPAQGHRPGRGRPPARRRASRSSPTRSSARPTRSTSCASGSTPSSSPSAPACRCSWTSPARTSRASTRPTST